MSDKTTVIEHDDDGYFEQVILQHSTLGRIYAVQRRWGEGTRPNWHDGLALLVPPTDTLETIKALEEKVINDYGVTALEMALVGRDSFWKTA